jgi:hypothetical protein
VASDALCLGPAAIKKWVERVSSHVCPKPQPTQTSHTRIPWRHTTNCADSNCVCCQSFLAGSDASESSSSEDEADAADAARSSSGSHSVGSSECAGCESWHGSDGEAAGSDGDDSASSGDYCSACEEPEESVAAALVPTEQVVAPPPSQPALNSLLVGRLAALGISLLPRVPSAREAEFRAWQAEKAEIAARLRGTVAPASSPPVPPPAPPAAPPAPPPAGSPRAHTSPPTPGTDEFALARPPPIPLAVAAPGPELEAQVEELMRRDSAVAVALAQAIFRRLPTGALAVEADRVYGAEHGLNEFAEARGRHSGEALPPRRLTVATAADGGSGAFHARERCASCDPFGSGSGVCSAIEVLDTLGHEFDAREERVAEELAEGCDEEATHRHARWYMYRTYVACKYGRLGAGVRVTIEDCVIAEIRSRFRAPGCDCSLDAIATCTQHGYRGHKSS